MAMTSYLPASARDAFPHSALQPLPAYLRPNFQQSLERDRPHELVPQVVAGKELPAQRAHCLTYRYLDSGDTVLVPNVWYNQTREMRLAHWTWLAAETQAKVKRQAARVEELRASVAHRLAPKEAERTLRHARWQLEALEANNAQVQRALADVRTGARFI